MSKLTVSKTSLDEHKKTDEHSNGENNLLTKRLYGKQLDLGNTDDMEATKVVEHRLPKKLLKHGVIRHVREVEPSIDYELSMDNYVRRFDTLISLEEIEEMNQMKELRLQAVKIKMLRPNFVEIYVRIGEDSKINDMKGSQVLLKRDNSFSQFDFIGFIHVVDVKNSCIHVNVHKRLTENIAPTDRFNIDFRYQRKNYNLKHAAVRKAHDKMEAVIFPVADANTSSIDTTTGGRYFNSLLNKRQRTATDRIVNWSAGSRPYIIFGPPGTGKSQTLAEVILQLLKKRGSKLLVCAPSNMAVNNLCEKLHGMGEGKEDFVRLNSLSSQQKLQKKSLYSTTTNTAEAIKSRCLFTTCTNVGKLFRDEGSPLFSHVIIDEAGQCTEPEVLVAISVSPEAKVVLAGDPMQLGPVVQSKPAKSYLEVSLMKRLMQRSLYMKDDQGIYNAQFITKLLQNYRSHEQLLSLPSRLFYGDELKACANKTEVGSMLRWKRLPKQGFPLIFLSVKGKCQREKFSYFNMEEAQLTVDYAAFLVNDKAAKATEISVITPYRKQIAKIEHLKKSSLKDVKVGSVERFQGQESKVVILSLVRTFESNKFQRKRPNVRRVLGFVADSKRFNVAVTRARSLLIIIGDSKALRLDKYWCELYDYCDKNGAVVFC